MFIVNLAIDNFSIILLNIIEKFLNKLKGAKMEHFENEKNEGNNYKKDGFFKYFLIFIATIIGAFLAFYFVVDITLKNLMNPAYQMHRMDKMFEKMDRQMLHDLNKDVMVVSKSIPNPVKIEKLSDEYKIIIDLKPFGNSAKNIKIDVEDGNLLKIEGSNEVKKDDKENMMSMSQSYLLENNVDKTKMTEKEEHGKYFVEIPFTIK